MIQNLVRALLIAFVVSTTMAVTADHGATQAKWIKKAIASVEKCRAKGKCQ